MNGTWERARGNLAWRLLAGLLVLDLVCALLFVAHWHLDAFASQRWDVSVEGSWPEWYGHVIEAAIVGFLLVLWSRRRDSHLLAWAATFLYVGLDDTIQIHEHTGKALIWLLGGHDAQFGIREQDVGELISWAIAGAIFCWLLVRTYRAAASPDVRADGLQLAMTLGLLVFCGMFLDTVDRVINPEWHQVARMAVIFEDVGELVALSLTLASVVAFWRRRAPAPVALRQEGLATVHP